MIFEHYNPTDESRSCVVRTMTKVTRKEYSTVKAELTALAQSMGIDEYNEEAVFERYMEEHGIYLYKKYNNQKFGELELENGTYCVHCTNKNGFYHLLPVIDNVIYDRRDDSRELYVIAVYKKQ